MHSLPRRVRQRMRAGRVASPGSINGKPVDRFTMVHFASGVALARLGAPFWTTCLLSVAWEVVEGPLKARFPDAFPNPTHDRTINAVTDTLAVLLGWRLGAASPLPSAKEGEA